MGKQQTGSRDKIPSESTSFLQPSYQEMMMISHREKEGIHKHGTDHPKVPAEKGV